MPTEDHRVRVAAERRERMRQRLIEAAIVVIGSGAANVIEGVIREAHVSRGTFYNYFENADGLVGSAARTVGEEIMEAVVPISHGFQDPAARMAAGIRSWMHLILHHSDIAAFFRHAGLFILETPAVRAEVRDDLSMGLDAGRFTVEDLELGFVLVSGSVLAAINSVAVDAAPAGFGPKLAERILIALGVAQEDARTISRSALPAPVLAPGSHLMGVLRAQKR